MKNYINLGEINTDNTSGFSYEWYFNLTSDTLNSNLFTFSFNLTNGSELKGTDKIVLTNIDELNVTKTINVNSIDLNKWYHLILTINSNGLADIYINGLKQHSSLDFGKVKSGYRNHCYFGAGPNTINKYTSNEEPNYSEMKVRYVRIYNNKMITNMEALYLYRMREQIDVFKPYQNDLIKKVNNIIPSYSFDFRNNANKSVYDYISKDIIMYNGDTTSDQENGVTLDYNNGMQYEYLTLEPEIKIFDDTKIGNNKGSTIELYTYISSFNVTSKNFRNYIFSFTKEDENGNIVKEFSLFYSNNGIGIEIIDNNTNILTYGNTDYSIIENNYNKWVQIVLVYKEPENTQLRQSELRLYITNEDQWNENETINEVGDYVASTEITEQIINNTYNRSYINSYNLNKLPSTWSWNNDNLLSDMSDISLNKTTTYSTNIGNGYTADVLGATHFRDYGGYLRNSDNGTSIGEYMTITVKNLIYGNTYRLKLYQYNNNDSNINGYRPIYINGVNIGENSYQDGTRNNTNNPSWSGDATAKSNGTIEIKFKFDEGVRSTDSSTYPKHIHFSGLHVSSYSEFSLNDTLLIPNDMKIKYFRIWNNNLSVDEIKELYRARNDDRLYVYYNRFTPVDDIEFKKALLLYYVDKDYSFKMFGKIKDWDTKNVTNMDDMVSLLSGDYNGDSKDNLLTDWNIDINNFYNELDIDISTNINAFNFNEDISNWDTSNVTSMKRMFYNANLFNINIITKTYKPYKDYESTLFNVNEEHTAWDISNVKNMESMFENAPNFDQRIHLMSVTPDTTTDMFKNATSYINKYSTLNGFNNGSPTSDFFNATKFNNITIKQAITEFIENSTTAENKYGSINGWDIDSVTDMSNLFENTSFNSDISLWNTSNVTNMYKTFSGANEFNQSLNNWDTSNVIILSSCFKDAIKFNQPIDNWDLSKTKYVNSMFENCSVFNQNIKNWNVSNVLNYNNMFNNTTLMNTDPYNAESTPTSVFFS